MKKLSYNCILTPNRTSSNREPSHNTSLSSSLSRKLRSSGSIRNGQASPMFPTVGKKKGCALENPEPSSPKQECSPQGNQRWVHLPLAICETLRRFGAEFNHCFFPCCTSRQRDHKEEEKAGGDQRDAIGGWLVALQEEEEEDRIMNREESSETRDVVEDIEIDEEKKDEFVGEEEEEKARVSLCIPPKNALLLMRCRSDPVKMAALANRFWDSTDQNAEEEEAEIKGSEIGSREIPEVNGNEQDENLMGEKNANVAETSGEEEKVGDDEKVGGESKSKEEEKEGKEKRETITSSCVLPECLVLMMCEPKLSMEVSKETWVCSTDYIQWLPDKKKKKDGRDEPKNRISIESKPPPPPPRSSCSVPAPAAGISMSTMIEQKLMKKPKSNACDCEPLVLTRCKSEPRRSSSASLMVAPEATLGISAAGVGF
ncbi:suppressor protein SRP40-like [Senna tora]|uniref:Suppressor protein SRP40-like n=1 Tax=Senna tora TaxID=362788 RepID=A0A834TKB8_9FABA|nr:suppressor protein SRP40-like [Senna tora]